MDEVAISQHIQTLYRSLSGKMVASLASYFGLVNLAIAEDVVQETFIAALDHWRQAGSPANPQAWLFRVCRNKALNLLSQRRVLPWGDLDFPDEARADYRLEQLFLDHEIKDNQLRLLFACCHPRLSPKAQVIFILKHLCGLRTEEIARGLMMTSEAVMKTLTRSRQILLEERVTLHVPFLFRSHDRLQCVQLAIYLLFNEGYNATAGDEVIRYDLCLEAMRLMRSILDIPAICTADSYAVMALMCFHASRFSIRLGSEGSLLEMEEQDRSQRDKDLVRLGMQYLNDVRITDPVASRFILEAAIASVHCSAETFEAIDWKIITGLYQQLQRIHASPVVDLSLAVAMFYAHGPDDALHVLHESTHQVWLTNSAHYHALLGKIHAACGHTARAAEAYKKALSLAKLRAEQDFISKKIASL